MAFRRTAFEALALANRAYIAATVTFYKADLDTGERTENLATLYDAPAGGNTVANPYTLDADGKVLLPIYFEDPIVAVINAGALGTHTTGVVWPVSGNYRGTWETDDTYFPGDTIIDGANGTNTGNLYVCTELHDSETWASDLGNYWELIIDKAGLDAAAAASAAAAAASASTASSAATTASSAASTASAAATLATTYATTTTSASSVAVGSGTKVFVVAAARQFQIGQDVVVADQAAPTTNRMYGTVTGWNSVTLTLTLSVYKEEGSGTISAWNVSIVGAQGAVGPTGASGTGSGDVVGPASATNNAVALFDGTTGTLLKNSGVTLPSGAIVGTSDSQTLTNKAMSGGTVDNAIVGGTTPAAGSFTELKGYRPADSTDADQTFALADASKLQRHTGASSRTWTIPANASVAFPTGTEIDIFNDGTGNIVLTAAASVVVNNYTAKSITLTPNQGGVLKKVDTNRWIYMGDNKTSWA